MTITRHVVEFPHGEPDAKAQHKRPAEIYARPQDAAQSCDAQEGCK